MRGSSHRLVALGLLALLGASATPHAAEACTVGTGTSASCTETALDTCLSGGGTVTFQCGPTGKTFNFTSTKTITADTTIDGGGVITFDGGGAVKLFAVNTGLVFTVEGLSFENGKAGSGDGGGAIGVSNTGTVQITNCTFSGNKAGLGAAVYLGNGTAFVSGSTFVNNQVTAGAGGAIVARNFFVSNSTFVNNLGSPGVLYEQDGTGVVTNCTFTGNPSGAVAGIGGGITLTNNIIDQGISSNCLGSPSGVLFDGGHNIAPANICGLKGAGCTDTMGTSICNAAPGVGLDPAGLADNGGPTQTIALCTGAGTPASCTGASAAIDFGDTGACAAPPVDGMDQRGESRHGATCDTGAFEVQAPGPTKSVPVLGSGALALLAAGVGILGWRRARATRAA